MSQTGTDVPESLQQAVDVLVERHGVAGAERELRERFGGRAARRELAALAYLRRRYQR